MHSHGEHVGAEREAPQEGAGRHEEAGEEDGGPEPLGLEEPDDGDDGDDVHDVAPVAEQGQRRLRPLRAEHSQHRLRYRAEGVPYHALKMCTV